MHRSWVVSAFVAAFLLAVPTASACSLAEVPPEPGAFFLWTPTDEQTHAVPVEGRELGASCELSNPFAVTSDRLAYASSNHGAETARVHVHNLTTNQTARVETQAERITDVSLFDGNVLTVEETYDGGREQTVHAYGLDAASSRRLPVDGSGGVQIVLEGALVIALDRGGDIARLSVYDAREDAWRFQDRALDDPAVPEHPGIRAASTSWLLLSLDDPTAYHLDRGEASKLDLPNGASPVGIDGDRLFYATRDDGQHGLYRVDLPDGEHSRVGTAEHEALGAGAGWIVLGAYSAPNATDGNGSVIEPSQPVSAPGLGLVVGLVGLAAALCGERS